MGVQQTFMPHIFNDVTGRLTIIDPHRPDNNISGGTNQIDEIISCFSLAHQSLVNRLESYEKRDRQDQSHSFLECLIGGNFTPYENSRQSLYDLFATTLKGRPNPSIPVPPPPTKREADPPPPGAKSDGQPLSSVGRALTAVVRK